MLGSQWGEIRQEIGRHSKGAQGAKRTEQPGRPMREEETRGSPRMQAAESCPAERFQGPEPSASGLPQTPSAAGQGEKGGQAQSSRLGEHGCSLAPTSRSPARGLLSAHQPGPTHDPLWR